MSIAETTFWHADLAQTLNTRTRTPSEADTIWDQLGVVIRDFKGCIASLAKELTTNGAISTQSAREARGSFEECMLRIAYAIGYQANVNDDTREIVGERIFEEFLPYLSLTKTAQRFFTKPRGYAGDFYTIEMMYNKVVGGHNELGRLIDELFCNMPPAKAVRNRRRLLSKEILGTLRNDSVAQVMSIACGPARELTDVYEQLEDPKRLRSTLIDIDEQAISFVRDKVSGTDFGQQMSLHQENVVYLSVGRRKLDLEPQDLIYSIGLIDYFSDKHVVRLMDYAYKQLKPGGKLILGNFHAANLHKLQMDYILDWKLIHRDEADMDRLFSQSRFAKPCTEIVFEEEGINMFAMCTK